MIVAPARGRSPPRPSLRQGDDTRGDRWGFNVFTLHSPDPVAEEKAQETFDRLYEEHVTNEATNTTSTATSNMASTAMNSSTSTAQQSGRAFQSRQQEIKLV